MTSKFTELAIDCADPGRLARFWCSVFDYEVQDEDDGIVTIGSPMVPEGKDHPGPVPPTSRCAGCVPNGTGSRPCPPSPTGGTSSSPGTCIQTSTGPSPPPNAARG